MTVSDHQDGFSRIAPLFDLFKSEVDGIQQRRLAFCRTEDELVLESGNVGCEVLRNPRAIVELHQEVFVFEIIEELGPGITGYRTGERVLIGAITPCGQCEFCLEGGRNAAVVSEGGNSEIRSTVAKPNSCWCRMLRRTSQEFQIR